MSEDASENQHSSISGSHDYRITEKALLLSGGGLLSKILGFFRDLAISVLFPREVTDAWALAFRIPHFCRRFFGEGVLSGALTPLMVESPSLPQSRLGARADIARLVWMVTLAWAVVVVIAVIGAEHLFSNLNIQGVKDKDQLSMALAFFKAMAIYLWSLVPISLLSAVALYQNRFWLVALTPVLFNSLILIFLFLWESMTVRVGWSLSFAGLIQLILLLPVFKNTNWQNQQSSLWALMRSFLRRFSSATASIGFAPLLGFVAAYFASSLPTGTLSYFFWAERLLEFPLTLTSSSLVLAAMPVFARGAKLQNDFSDILKVYILANLKWVLPAFLGLVMGTEMIVHVLFDWGQFSLTESAMLIETVYYNGWIFLFVAASRIVLSVGIAKGIPQMGRWAWMHLGLFFLGGLLLQRSSFWNFRFLLIWMLVVTFCYFLSLTWYLRKELEVLLTRGLWAVFMRQSVILVPLTVYLSVPHALSLNLTKAGSFFYLAGAAALVVLPSIGKFIRRLPAN